jgi:hypothetical protein
LPGTPPPPVLDYFPTTVNSNWVYYSTNPSDSITTKVLAYTPTYAGHSYASFESNTIPPTTPFDTSYYRKLGSDYYQYTDFSNYFAFSNPILGEFIFLKDNVIQGSTWQSQNFAGTISGFGPATGYISMTLLAKAVAVSIGTQNFPDVIKVRYDYYISVTPGGPFYTEEKWYARGVGLIHDDATSPVIDVNRYTIY